MCDIFALPASIQAVRVPWLWLILTAFVLTLLLSTRYNTCACIVKSYGNHVGAVSGASPGFASDVIILILRQIGWAFQSLKQGCIMLTISSKVRRRPSYVYMYIYIYIYVCVCVYVYVYMYVCVYMCICVCMYVYMYVCVYICVRIYVLCVCIRICLCTYMLHSASMSQIHRTLKIARP